MIGNFYQKWLLTIVITSSDDQTIHYIRVPTAIENLRVDVIQFSRIMHHTEQLPHAAGLRIAQMILKAYLFTTMIYYTIYLTAN